MADNTVLSTNVGTGDTIRTLEDGSAVKWPVTVIAYATTVGTPDVLTVPAAAALADGMANPTVPLADGCLLCFNGTTWDRARGDTANGLDVDVTRLPALPAGGNVIGAVTQSGTWNVGTVTTVTGVATVTTVSTVTSLSQWAGNAIDTNSGAKSGGTLRVVIATDQPALSNAQPVSDNGGSLTVDAPVGTPVFVRLSDGSSAITTLPVSLASVPSHAVTNAGTFAVQVDGAALTALQLIDDTVFSDDAAFTPATSKVSAAGFLADETATDSVDEGDIGIARMTMDRKVHVVQEAESNSIRAGGTALTPKFAAVAAASSGANTLVAAVTSKKIRVLSLCVVAAGAVSVYFTTAAAGAVIFGGSTNKIALAANGGFVLPFNPLGWFETVAGDLLNLNLSGAVAVSGGLSYCEV